MTMVSQPIEFGYVAFAVMRTNGVFQRMFLANAWRTHGSIAHIIFVCVSPRINPIISSGKIEQICLTCVADDSHMEDQDSGLN